MHLITRLWACSKCELLHLSKVNLPASSLIGGEGVSAGWTSWLQESHTQIFSPNGTKPQNEPTGVLPWNWLWSRHSQRNRTKGGRGGGGKVYRQTGVLKIEVSTSPATTNGRRRLYILFLSPLHRHKAFSSCSEVPALTNVGTKSLARKWFLYSGQP